MSELTSLISELVRIDSVNPALDPAHQGETELARFVERWAQNRGLETQWLEPEPGRPSVIVRAPGTGSGRTLMLNAHLDTVGVTGMDAPFEPRLEGGRLYGRGVMDMKASLAACLLSVAAARELELAGDVIVTAVSDEEHASIGTRAVLEATRADAAIVTEPSDLELQLAHRGFAVFEVELTGKASHTSQPEKGVNALTQLGRLLCEVERHDERLRRGEPHPLLGYGSLQAVTAQGGHELFTTPANAVAAIERRTLPGESVEGVRRELEELIDRLAKEDSTLQASVRTLVAREPFETPSGSEIEEILAAAVRKSTRREPRRLGAPYWTDAALIAAAGIPTLLFGPIGGGIHQTGEWLDLESAHTFLEVLNRVTVSYCRG